MATYFELLTCAEIMMDFARDMFFAETADGNPSNNPEVIAAIKKKLNRVAGHISKCKSLPLRDYVTVKWTGGRTKISRNLLLAIGKGLSDYFYRDKEHVNISVMARTCVAYTTDGLTLAQAYRLIQGMVRVHKFGSRNPHSVFLTQRFMKRLLLFPSLSEERRMKETMPSVETFNQRQFKRLIDGGLPSGNNLNDYTIYWMGEFKDARKKN